MARLAELEEIAAQEREAELARQASELAGRVNEKRIKENLLSFSSFVYTNNHTREYHSFDATVNFIGNKSHNECYVFNFSCSLSFVNGINEMWYFLYAKEKKRTGIRKLSRMPFLP